MKLYRITLLVLGAAWSMAVAVQAVTPDWTYESTNAVFQVVPDGKGGCAVVLAWLLGPPQGGRLLWFDSDGTVRYQAGLSNILGGAVIDCTDKQLIFADARPAAAVYLVDDKGAIAKVPSPPGSVNKVGISSFPIAIYRNDVVYDKKGFFVVEAATNQTSSTLIRYTNK